MLVASQDFLLFLHQIITSLELFPNIFILCVCYLYVFFIILLTRSFEKRLNIESKKARKFLHCMMGNLIFIIPFFSNPIYPTIVAGSFIVVTWLASPVSPSAKIKEKLSSLAMLSSEGHPWGLIFYCISYTILAFFFSTQTVIMAAGIMPLAYGDSLAALVGEKYGLPKYRILGPKTLPGSLGMLFGSFMSLLVTGFYFSIFWGVQLLPYIVLALIIAVIATFIELFSPKGIDNITIPLICALIFYLAIQVILV